MTGASKIKKDAAINVSNFTCKIFTLFRSNKKLQHNWLQFPVIFALAIDLYFNIGKNLIQGLPISQLQPRKKSMRKVKKSSRIAQEQKS